MLPEKKVIFGIISFFILLFVLSGCIIDNKDKYNWEDEILLASECGMDGLPCCPEKDQPCKFNQVCCVAPNNPEKNVCLDECSFGGLGEFCRAGDLPCDEGLACLKDRCVVCGLEGNPCCTDGLACATEENINTTRTECRNGICGLCGFSGNKICKSEPECNPGNLSSNNICFLCGGFNQPCCREDEGAEYDCDPSLGLKCERGFCS